MADTDEPKPQPRPRRTRRPTNPTGRPMKLTRPLADQILTAVRLAEPLHLAAEAAGINRATILDWTRRGAQLRNGTEHAPGFPHIDPATLTAEERLLAAFSGELVQARAEAAARLGTQVFMAATRPAVEIRETTRMIGKDEAGQPVYATETTRIQRPPDASIALEVLSRQWPEEWTRKQHVEVSGPDGGPIPLEARAAAASDRLRQLQSGSARALPAAPDDDEGESRAG